MQILLCLIYHVLVYSTSIIDKERRTFFAAPESVSNNKFSQAATYHFHIISGGHAGLLFKYLAEIFWVVAAAYQFGDV